MKEKIKNLCCKKFYYHFINFHFHQSIWTDVFLKVSEQNIRSIKSIEGNVQRIEQIYELNLTISELIIKHKMKNDRGGSQQQKRITIKRQSQQVSPVMNKNSQVGLLGQDKTIHVRRHSVIVSSNRHGSSHRHQQEIKIHDDRYERFKSKDLLYPQSYQSSKEIKSLSKYNYHKEIEYEYQNQKTQKFCIGYIRGGLNLKSQFMGKKNYEYINMIGKGGFGKVWRVKHKTTGMIFAMKQMSKATVIAKRSVDSIINERHLLSCLKNQFLVNMVYAFQDKTTLFLVMNIKQGGDLRYHLAKKHQFTQLETRFMIGTIILGLEYLHKKMIIHRDVKPENIVFDDMGYASLTDLGIAKYIKQENYQDTSGTPGYMAPEVMFHHNHRFEVDFYALGVIVYEIMMGKRPYVGKNRQEIKQLVLAKQVIIRKDQIPENWTVQSADFVNKLLQRKPLKRLGWGGVNQLKQHRWLRNFPWKQVMNKEIQSPFKQKYNPHEVRYRVTQFQTQFKKILNKNKQMLEKGNLQQYFDGYTYEGVTQSQQISKSTFLN